MKNKCQNSNGTAEGLPGQGAGKPSLVNRQRAKTIILRCFYGSIVLVLSLCTLLILGYHNYYESTNSKLDLLNISIHAGLSLIFYIIFLYKIAHKSILVAFIKTLILGCMLSILSWVVSCAVYFESLQEYIITASRFASHFPVDFLAIVFVLPIIRGLWTINLLMMVYDKTIRSTILKRCDEKQCQ